MNAREDFMPFASRPGDLGLIAAWLEHSAGLDRDPISAKAAPSYQHFWNSYLQYLQSLKEGGQPKPIRWYEATHETIAGFLQYGPRSRKSGATVSSITRRRYWRLLDRIYSFAQSRKWIERNPVLALTEAETPPMEDPRGAILTPQLWTAALQLIGEMEDDAIVVIRNRALLLCLFHLGLSPQEIRTLAIKDVLRSTEEGGSAPGGITGLQLDGPGPNQRRRLLVPAVVAEALARWLTLRTIQAKTQQGSPLLFCSTRSVAMSPDNLLSLVKALLIDAAARAEQPLPARMGPQIVRNTRLVMWLNEGVPADQVVIRAGLKNTKGLYHLRDHTNPEVRIDLRNDRDDAPLQRPAEIAVS